MQNELTSYDLHFVLSRMPKDLLGIIKKHGLILAGGFIRETISGGKVSDIDLFGETVDKLELAALTLCTERKAKKHETGNAITVLAPPRLPVQFIKRWLFADSANCVASFDFTVCQAAIWWDSNGWDSNGYTGAGKDLGFWRSVISESFYSDLAARRLVYTYPQRDEDAGGSMLRMRKFIQRGYSIQSASMAGVISRLVSRVELNDFRDERKVSKILTALLREVDPLVVVDGVELVDEHEILDNIASKEA